MKKIVRGGLAAVAVAAVLLAAGGAQAEDSPEALLQVWLAAIAQNDYAAYVECLHTGTREVPEYGSEEAMAFWSGEMDELSRMGFTGQFEFEVVSEGSSRFPVGSVRALPIVDGHPMREAIVLIQEAGHWTILRLFS